MKKIETICIVPVWKRPEILLQTVENNSKFVSDKFDFVYIVSQEDPYFEEIMSILRYKYIIIAPNKPLGEKLNIGIRRIKALFKFKYLMNLGSDDLLLADIIDIYKHLIRKEVKLFGYNSCYAKEANRDEMFTLKNLHPDHAIGAGRMIHISLLDKDIYTADLNRGLDSNSMLNLNHNCKLLEGVAPIVDIKTNTNINTFEFLMKCGNLDSTDLDFSTYQ